MSPLFFLCATFILGDFFIKNPLAHRFLKNIFIILPGFGKLVKVQGKARKGRNPATGEVIKIKAKTVVKFRVAKACKDAVL